MLKQWTATAAIAAASVLSSSSVSLAQAESDEELAKELANPVAALISVPVEYKHDQDVGPAEPTKSTLSSRVAKVR